MALDIREERPGDVGAIRELNRAAFGRDQEGDLVDALRAGGAVLLSLVAEWDGRIVVGHVMYSPASIAGIVGAALGPMAVLPEHQRRGIGSRLVTAGNRMLKEAHHPFVVVVGHTDFYPRFGFRPASLIGIRCAWNVPDDVFMALVFDDARMRGISGSVAYRREFSDLT